MCSTNCISSAAAHWTSMTSHCTALCKSLVSSLVSLDFVSSLARLSNDPLQVVWGNISLAFPKVLFVCLLDFGSGFFTHFHLIHFQKNTIIYIFLFKTDFKRLLTKKICSFYLSKIYEKPSNIQHLDKPTRYFPKSISGKMLQQITKGCCIRS